MKAALLAIALGGCTILAPAATGGVILTHNASTDSADRWSYQAPVTVAAVVGLVFDLLVTTRLVSSVLKAADSGAAVGNAFSHVAPR